MFFSPDTPLEQRSWPRRLLNRLEVDRAVFYELAVRVWQLAAGPVTIVLIAAYFSQEVQGYFYVFANLMAFSTVAELGLSTVIMNAAAHQWAHLELDEQGNVAGDDDVRARLLSLVRFAIRWNAGMAALFAAAMGVGGALFIAYESNADVLWLPQWIAVVALTSLTLWLMPFLGILIGSGQIRTVSRIRFLQVVTGNVAVWTCIPLGANIWTCVAVAGVTFLWDAYTVLVHFRRFWSSLRQTTSESHVDVWEEVLPLQWRIAIQTVLLTVIASLFTLLSLHYEGLAASGRMGMTWTALIALHRGALAWVQTRAPRFGVFIARREYGDLDRMFIRVTAISFALRALGGAVIIAIVYLLNVVEHSFAERMADRLLSPLALLPFVAAVVLDHLPQAQMIYARAHKREPYFRLSIVANIAVVAAVWLAASADWGAVGMGCAYLAVTAGFIVPAWSWVWAGQRTQWHQ